MQTTIHGISGIGVFGVATYFKSISNNNKKLTDKINKLTVIINKITNDNKKLISYNKELNDSIDNKNKLIKEFIKSLECELEKATD